MDDDEYIIDISTVDSYSSTTTVDTISNISIDTSTLATGYNFEWDNIMDDIIDLDSITIIQPVEFEDEMPSVAKVEDMCRDYPALEKAYENFKTVYKLVHQDWQGRQDDEPPF